MRCGCLALILVAAFVTVDNPNSAQIAGHLVVAAKGGTNCARIVSNTVGARTAHTYAARSGAGAASRSPTIKIGRVQSTAVKRPKDDQPTELLADDVSSRVSQRICCGC